MEPIKFGVVIVTFNRPKLLERAVNSLLSQSSKNWVAVIVNNGSSIEPFSDSRVEVLEMKENLGSNRARNIGIDRVLELKADYITIIDDDDFLENDSFAEAEKSVLESRRSWLISNCLKPDEKLKESRDPILEKREFDYIDNYLYGKGISGDRFHLIKSSLLEKARFSEEVLNGEEWLFFIELAKREKMFAYPHISLRKDYQEGGLTKSKKEKTLQKLFLDTKKPLLSLYLRPTNWRAFRKMVSRVVKFPLKALLISIR
jgi:glycosyltransferase involved in cell wall biosynthesis